MDGPAVACTPRTTEATEGGTGCEVDHLVAVIEARLVPEIVVHLR